MSTSKDSGKNRLDNIKKYFPHRQNKDPCLTYYKDNVKRYWLMKKYGSNQGKLIIKSRPSQFYKTKMPSITIPYYLN